jgi:hypothetical protein
VGVSLLAATGFTNKNLRVLITGLLGCSPYTPGQMTYDLRRLRLNGLIRRLPRSNRYVLTDDGIRIAVFKAAAFTRTTAAVQRCMDAGVASPGDAATVALDLRTAVIGMLSLRINEPDLPWPPFPEQADRFLSKLVGLAPPAGETTVPQAK